jgi:1-acyl-sn-glycerol-3-phosphate acyltransferase
VEVKVEDLEALRQTLKTAESESNSSDETTQKAESDVDRWGRSESMRQFAHKALEPFYKHWFRVEWEGMENIPKKGGALLVSNHAGAIPPDAMLIMHGIETELKRPVYGLADFWFRTIPFVGTFWNRAGGLSAHPDNAYQVLHDDKQLALVFPEGTKGTSKLYSERYKLRRFGRGGFVEIAMKAGVPVIPIAVLGAEEAMPILFKMGGISKALGLPYFPITLNQIVFSPVLGPILGSLLYFPVKIRIKVLKPVYFDVPPDQARYSKGRVMEESEQIRITIQEALYEMLGKRKNPLTG